MTPVSSPGVLLNRTELATLLPLAEEGLRRRLDMGVGSSVSLRYAGQLITDLSAVVGRLTSGVDSVPSGGGGSSGTIDVVRDEHLSDGPSRWCTPRQVASLEGCTDRWVRVKAERGEYVGAHRDGSGWRIPRTSVQGAST